MNIIRKEAQHTSQWSGGTTTELFIFPPESKYSERNFQFRISTATVETETSTFTALPDYKRILMILKGELEITHAGLYSKKLMPFEQELFDGSWQTSAKGMVTDFNIMFREGYTSSLVSHQLKSNEQITLNPISTFSFGYLISGELTINTQTLTQGDFVVFDTNVSTHLHAQSNTIWLEISITQHHLSEI